MHSPLTLTTITLLLLPLATLASPADCTLKVAANCYSGPDPSSDIVARLPPGQALEFQCYTKGGCVAGSW
ncbi:hypothetical protein V492_06907 [Pseudogymnoascus sp. VKM F-4246]|nr:hypothetical protein V492_06907 [Pseudogymnoascus sp. VKM F-4246]